MRIPTSVEMPSRLSLLPALAMTPKSGIWKESLGGLAPLNVFVSIKIYVIAWELELTCFARFALSLIPMLTRSLIRRRKHTEVMHLLFLSAKKI